MDAANFDRMLRGLLSRKPFHPFTVVMNTGDQFEIDHPTALATNGGAAVYLTPGSIPIFFDFTSVNQFVGDLKTQESNTEP